MGNSIHPIPAFADNYIWIFSDPGTNQACVVDPGDSSAVIKYLESHGLTLSTILVTHHHPDHTGGVKDLTNRFNSKVYGPKNSPFDGIGQELEENNTVSVFGYQFRILQVPGHTLDHIAYYCESPPSGGRPLLFCGDTLFAAGCGRIFEGNPVMMFASLQKLAGLPAATEVYCTHEYTLANLKFAATAEPDNPQLQERIAAARITRQRDLPTLPSSIALELATNPFLRCAETPLLTAASQHAGAELQDPVEVFATLRRWKDQF
ncbi:MAG: hydroxyacylglutathione hydrolase [Gammaproteobacteria bacterium]|nr:hydroxyacylglutathione hydrolase [Pseudomonadales bacterium]MCP5346352.1 hydroxyacylglutathione hydrolase [Pseudomonadales bacterium]